MNNFSLPRIVVWVAIALSLPFVALLGTWAGEGNTRGLAMVAGGVALVFLVVGVPQWLWIAAVGSMFVPGILPFLPLPFKMFELFLLLLLARFVIEDIVFKKRWIRLGPKPDRFFILGLVFILLLHGFEDRFAMRSLGSDVWGGRSYFGIILGLAIYFVLQSTSLDAQTFRRLPSVVVAFGFIDFGLNAVTFALPDLAIPLSNIYTNISFDTGVTFARRLGFAGNFGYLLLFWSLSDCRLQDFLQRGRLLKAAVFFLGLLLCLASGYRSTLIIASLIVALAAFRDLGASSVFLLIPVSLILVALVGLHLAGVQLPVTIQRGLTWVPGAGWDEAATYDATGSLEFRKEVRDMWLQTQFPKSPLLGRGFGLPFDDMIATLPFTGEDSSGYAATAQMLSKYTRDEAFVVSGNLHHGFFSVVDRFGAIGALCFVLWTICVFWRMFRELISSRNSPMNPPLQWLALYVMAFTLGYPFGALKIENFLPQQLFLCGLFVALQAASRNASPKPVDSHREQEAMGSEAIPAGHTTLLASRRN